MHVQTVDDIGACYNSLFGGELCVCCDSFIAEIGGICNGGNTCVHYVTGS